MAEDCQIIKGGKKECSICREWKSLDDFWKDKYLRSGYNSQCKLCKGQRHKRW